MIERMPARVLMGWQKFYEVEPFGLAIEDYRAGIIASVIANVYRDKKRRSKPFEPHDFVPKRVTAEGKSEKRPKTPTEMLRFVEAMTLAMGGKDMRPEWKRRG